MGFVGLFSGSLSDFVSYVVCCLSGFGLVPVGFQLGVTVFYTSDHLGMSSYRAPTQHLKDH